MLRYCNERRIGVVPQGGNTGLVGGSVPLNNEIIISLEQFDTIHPDPTTNDCSSDSPRMDILKCDAGCILQDVQDYAAARGQLLPLDLGAKGTCQIGGNVSTNAGGSYYYRYGSLHANVVGLEVVLPDGRILDCSYHDVNLKDNTGYDMKHLFIGAEGTLGVVTKIALKCPPLPKARCAAFLACETFDQVLHVLRVAKMGLSEILAAFEFLDQRTLEFIAGHGIPIPLTRYDSQTQHPYCVLVETHGSNEVHDQAKMEDFLQRIMEDGWIIDGILAQNLGQVHDMWRVRESANPSVAAQGYVYKYDISLPIPDFPGFIEEMQHRLSNHFGYHHHHHHHTSHAEAVVNANWGHVIDGNLHFNVVWPGKRDKDTKLLDSIEPFIFESVIRRGGSISAEHGLGQSKNQYLPMIRDRVALDTMRAIKNLFDPHGIMNPGKYLPDVVKG